MHCIGFVINKTFIHLIRQTIFINRIHIFITLSHSDWQEAWYKFYKSYKFFSFRVMDSRMGNLKSDACLRQKFSGVISIICHIWKALVNKYICAKSIYSLSKLTKKWSLSHRLSCLKYCLIFKENWSILHSYAWPNFFEELISAWVMTFHLIIPQMQHNSLLFNVVDL